MVLTPAVSAMAGKRAALASPIRLNAAATRRSAATTSGRRSSSSEGRPAGISRGTPGNCGDERRCGRWVAAEQELERSNRLLTRQLELTEDIAIGPDAGPRDEYVLLTADPDTHAVAGEADELLVGTNGLACCLNLQSRLGGEEPALGHERRNRLSRVLEIRLRRAGLRAARRPAIAHPSPEIELPVRVEGDTRKT